MEYEGVQYIRSKRGTEQGIQFNIRLYWFNIIHPKTRSLSSFFFQKYSLKETHSHQMKKCSMVKAVAHGNVQCTTSSSVGQESQHDELVQKSF